MQYNVFMYSIGSRTRSSQSWSVLPIRVTQLSASSHDPFKLLTHTHLGFFPLISLHAPKLLPVDAVSSRLLPKHGLAVLERGMKRLHAVGSHTFVELYYLDMFHAAVIWKNEVRLPATKREALRCLPMECSLIMCHVCTSEQLPWLSPK